MRAGRMGCRIGCRPGNDCDAPDRYVSSAGGHRPAGGGIKQYVVVIPIRAGWHRCGVADAFRICLAQSRRARSQQERRLACQMVVAIARRVRIWQHFSDMPRQSDDVRSPGDIVAKVFLGGQTKFFRAADAFYERRCERPHRFIQNRPGTSVVALKSDTAAEKSKDQLSRDFPGRSIFDFCNTIQGKADV